MTVFLQCCLQHPANLEVALAGGPLLVALGLWEALGPGAQGPRAQRPWALGAGALGLGSCAAQFLIHLPWSEE